MSSSSLSNSSTKVSSKQNILTFKVILLGHCNVGKTSIFQRFKDGTFREQQRPTIGIDNSSVTKDIDGKPVTLVLWDTAGTERFRTLTQNYYRSSHACLLVYSMDEPESLACLGQWVNDANIYAESAMKILVGNKTDRKHLVDQRKVEEFATHHNCDCIFQVSAKLGEGVEEMFKVLAHKLMERVARTRSQTSQRLFDDDGDSDSIVPTLRNTDRVRLVWLCCS